MSFDCCTRIDINDILLICRNCGHQYTVSDFLHSASDSPSIPGADSPAAAVNSGGASFKNGMRVVHGDYRIRAWSNPDDFASDQLATEVIRDEIEGCGGDAILDRNVP